MEAKYPCTETNLKFNCDGSLSRTRLFKRNYVEIFGKQSNIGCIKEDWNGKEYIPSTVHRRSTSGSFDHFQHGKDGRKFGIITENNIKIVYEDKNNNGKFDTEEAWYYNEQGKKIYLF